MGRWNPRDNVTVEENVTSDYDSLLIKDKTLIVTTVLVSVDMQKFNILERPFALQLHCLLSTQDGGKVYFVLYTKPPKHCTIIFSGYFITRLRLNVFIENHKLCSNTFT